MSTGRQSAAGIPRWVIGFIVVGAIALATVGIVMVMGHGPWQHGAMTGMHH